MKRLFVKHDSRKELFSRIEEMSNEGLTKMSLLEKAFDFGGQLIFIFIAVARLIIKGTFLQEELL